MTKPVFHEGINVSDLYSADIETTGLLDQLKEQGGRAKLHNFGAKRADGSELLFTNVYNAVTVKDCEQVYPLTDLQAFLDTGPILVMHNGITYDGPALEMLGYDISKVRILDTLYLAWYLEPTRNVYGLEAYGEMFGVPKPPIIDWINGPQSEYNYRVLQDCRIQHRLWKRLWDMLLDLYEGSLPAAWKLINHLCAIKGKHLRTQQEVKWKVDLEGAAKLSAELHVDKEARFVELIEVMPRKPVFKTRKRPKKLFKMNGHLANYGESWVLFCLLYNVDVDSVEEYTYQDGDEAGNPNAPQQVKDWLFSLGWEPETFEYKRNKETNEERVIPQINIKNSGGELDPGIERLIEDHPELQRLKGLGIVKHRIGIVDGWIRDNVDGYVIARAAGFTNTLRLKHAEVVNVPSERVPYGKRLRALLTVENPEDEILLGSDLSSLEDRCKHHYQIPLDPEYVKAQMTEGFDPHVTIAVMGEFCTQEDYEFYVAYELGKIEETPENKARFKRIKEVRGLGKRTNYGCQYGARPPRLARDAKISIDVATRLFDAYWSLNWSINTIAENTEVKKCLGVEWQLNPVNNIWYYLKTKKDRFSTLCQGTGAYAFDIWVEEIFQICQERWGRDPFLVGQFHDEIILRIKRGEKWEKLWHDVVKEAIARANKILGMRREIDCEIQFGSVYSEIH